MRWFGNHARLLATAPCVPTTMCISTMAGPHMVVGRPPRNGALPSRGRSFPQGSDVPRGGKEEKKKKGGRKEWNRRRKEGRKEEKKVREGASFLPLLSRFYFLLSTFWFLLSSGELNFEWTDAFQTLDALETLQSNVAPPTALHSVTAAPRCSSDATLLNALAPAQEFR